MELKPNPCPWCGRDDVRLACDYSGIYVGCMDGCAATGPAERTNEQAIAAWNRVAKANEEQQTAPSGQGD